MDNFYKRAETRDTRISIYQDECVRHPFDVGMMECGIACWSTNEIFGSFLPETDVDSNYLFDDKETFQAWLRQNPNIVVCGVRWWGVVCSDMSHLVLYENPDFDEEYYDGAIFIEYFDGNREKALETIKKDVNILNAYLGDCVYCYVVESKKPLTQDQYKDIQNLYIKANNYKLGYTPTFEQLSEALHLDNWTVVDSNGGYYHDLSNDGSGDKKMCERMFSDMTGAYELDDCMRELTSKC